jgi:hypothetical protein
MGGGLESRCISRVCGADGAAPDGRMYPKHVELRIHQYNYLVASSWHFKLFFRETKFSNGCYQAFLENF